MPIHILKLVKRTEVARHTHTFSFTKPEGFQFKPGQYGGFTLINPTDTDAGGITRRFSLLSTPADEHITIATRMQPSAYKRVLNQFDINSEIKFAGPTGNFILHDDVTTPAVFIAGGIGITPFYSILCDAAQKKSAQTFYLFYGNQSQADAAFLAELQNLQHQLPNFKLIATMANDPTWTGEQGFISQSMLKKYLPDLHTPIYYVCGSPTMVTALQEALVELDIPEEHIKVEDFPGY